MRGEITRITGELIESIQGRERIDIVDDFAYPLPVTVICRLLGVPREDEPVFHEWSATIIDSVDIRPGEDPSEHQGAGLQARTKMGRYLVHLAEQRRGRPSDDMLSAFVNDDPAGRLTREELAATAALLLVAGHETTVNLITNGVLTLLRHPDQLDRLRREPGLLPGTVEELLRYEPPVHMLQRAPLAHVDVAGTTIPKGVPVVLVLASGNRDPRRFGEPDRFDPGRPDNHHLGFGSHPPLLRSPPRPDRSPDRPGRATSPSQRRNPGRRPSLPAKPHLARTPAPLDRSARLPVGEMSRLGAAWRTEAQRGWTSGARTHTTVRLMGCSASVQSAECAA
jgi:cytochrome P450